MIKYFKISWICLVLVPMSPIKTCDNQSEADLLMIILEQSRELEERALQLDCSKKKTFFNAKIFLESTNLNISSSVLKELETSSKSKSSGSWDKGLTKSLFNKVLLSRNICINKDDFESTKNTKSKDVSLITLSQPLFDKNCRYAIIDVTFTSSTGNAKGYTCFAKKIDGTWSVIAKYQLWMS